MLLPGCNIVRTCCFFMVLIATVISYPYPDDDKTFDLKLGFDLTNGDNGTPSLRIRDFEDSRQFIPRAAKSESNSSSRKSEEEEEENSEEKKPPPKKKSKAKLLRNGSSAASSSASVEVSEKKPEAVKPKEEPISKADVPKSKSSEDSVIESGESDIDTKHSTRGLRPGEFEPEDKNPRLHSADNDDDDRRRRVKRAAANISKYLEKSAMKRKLKKVRGKALRARSTTPGY